MAEQTTETRSSTEVSTESSVVPWQAGVVGGLIGAAGFGVLMSMMSPGVLEMAIPALYGIEGPAGLTGWVIHMSHGAIIGVIYAAIASTRSLTAYTTTVGRGVIAGIIYGVVVWGTLAVIVMPIWLSMTGFPGAPPLPNIAIGSLVGHSVYGLLLGLIFAVLIGD